MQPAHLLHWRLQAQQLEGSSAATPLEAVRRLGAVQSQDYGGAAWAVAQRTMQATATDFATAFAAGSIVRTHVMRPTWHFVAAEDIVWLAALTRDRLFQTLGYYFKKFSLTEHVLRNTDAIITAALANGTQLTRNELATALAAQHIDVSDTVGLSHIVLHAEANGLICSGAPRGKQQTYALLSDRAPQAKQLERPAALAELAQRYFTSHGPATLADFAWWSGLTRQEAVAGLKAASPALQYVETAGKTYWLSHAVNLEHMQRQMTNTPQAHFLPNYDEYIVAYADRTGLFDPVHTPLLDSRQNPLFNNALIIDGAMAGTWKKTERKSQTTVSLTMFRSLTKAEAKAVHQASERYAAYLSMPVVVEGLE